MSEVVCDRWMAFASKGRTVRSAIANAFMLPCFARAADSPLALRCRLAPLCVLDDVYSDINRRAEPIEITDVACQRFFGSLAQGCCRNHFPARQCCDVVTILIRKPGNLRNRQIQRGKQPHLDHRGIDAFKGK